MKTALASQTLLCTVLVLVLLAWTDVSANPLLCAGRCLNGGTLLPPRSVFGYCRCECRTRFRGPRCEFFVYTYERERLKKTDPSADKPIVLDSLLNSAIRTAILEIRSRATNDK